MISSEVAKPISSEDCSVIASVVMFWGGVIEGAVVSIIVIV